MGKLNRRFSADPNNHRGANDADRDRLEFRNELKRDGRRLDYVFEQAWASFCKYPGIKEYAEFQTLPLSFWIIHSATEGQSPGYELMILLNSGADVPDVLNPDDEVHQISFVGDEAWKQIESFVYERLGLSPGSLTLYELPGQHNLKIPL